MQHNAMVRRKGLTLDYRLDTSWFVMIRECALEPLVMDFHAILAIKKRSLGAQTPFLSDMQDDLHNGQLRGF